LYIAAFLYENQKPLTMIVEEPSAPRIDQSQESDVIKEPDMRYVLMVLGVIGLAMGFLMFANAHHPDHIPQASVALQLGGIFLAIGMATADIVEAVKGKPIRDRSGQGAGRTTATE
jgi:hypothetical protein